MLRVACVVAAGLSLGGCVTNAVQRQREADVTAAVQKAATACDARTYPTARARATCLNEVEERIVGPAFPYADLFKTKLLTRTVLAEKVDARQMTQAEADLHLAQATTRLTSEAELRSNSRRSVVAQEAVAAAASDPVMCIRSGRVTNCY